MKKIDLVKIVQCVVRELNGIDFDDLSYAERRIFRVLEENGILHESSDGDVTLGENWGDLCAFEN